METGLNFLDWAIITVYLAGMIGMSYILARGQRNHRDYYLCGNRAGPLPIALSTMATQCSTNSLLGAPAFVAFAAGGGLLWLQYELAVPFAMIVLMLVLFPIYRGLNLVSLYAYLEKRYGPGTRTAVSILFQFLRAFSTGVTVYGISLVLQVCLGLELWAAILLLGGITILYDSMGGMRAVIWSDVIQIILLFSSIVAAIGVTVHLTGGIEEVFRLADPGRLRAVDFAHHGLGDGHDYSFWPMLFGGFFLYLSYYGCDQTQAQRELSSRSVEGTAKALFFDGMLRFPLVLTYCFLGVCLAAYAVRHPEFLGALSAADGGAGEPNYNLAVPVLILRHFPHGAIGLVMVGLFAAAMSSLDSTINSLSALSMEDIVRRYIKKDMTARQGLVASKLLTVFWGLVCLVSAFFVENISGTVIESVNLISSLINGPLLAVFLLGMLTRRANSYGAVAGLIVGFAGNLLLWKFAPGVSWLWWNVIGFGAAAAAGYLASLLFPPPEEYRIEGLLHERHSANSRRCRPRAIILAVYGLAIFLLLAFL